ncbi:unnamed protein product [Didymodactylos carnosus]|nr:unnamed protein product [Didymodactylos carnosus]CAF4004045.1 unnamed protein product [Didymodactylos carnosus]
MRDLTKESGSFIWHQLLKEVLQKMPSGDKNAKEEMLEKCRLYYRGNKKELQNIEEFEKSYSVDNAINWYTRDSYVFKLINKALRTEDAQALYTFRFYLVDLRAQLSENHQLILDYHDTLILYRGCKLTQDEIERLKDGIGQLISTNGFLSTSENRDIAEIYAGVGVTHTTFSSGLESAIFEISIDTKKHQTTILADISFYSRFRDESEFLFDLGTVFEIEDLHYEQDKKCWICKMTASEKGFEIAKEYVNFQRNGINDSELDISIIFGNLLYEMGECVKSQQYFDMLLLLHSEKFSIEARCGLGRAYMRQGEYDKALSILQKAYDLCIDNELHADPKLVKILVYMGQSYDIKGDHKTALDCYFKALELAEKIGRKMDIAYVLSKTGFTYYRQGEDDLSLQCFQRSYAFLQGCVPREHIDMADYYNNMMMVFYHKGNYGLAVAYQCKAVEIYNRLSPNNNFSRCAIFNNLGKMYYKQCDYHQALKCLRESLDTARIILKGRDNYINMGAKMNNIGKCLYRQKNYAGALRKYESMMELMKQANVLEHRNLAYTLTNIGEVYLELKNFDLALDFFMGALNMYKRVYNNPEHRDVGKCLNLIGEVYYNKNSSDDDTCFSYYAKALTIWKNVLSSDHPDLALCYKNIALWYLNRQKDYHKATEYCTLSRLLYEQTLKAEHPHLVEVRRVMRSIDDNRWKVIIGNVFDTLKLVLLLLLFSFSCWF